MRHNKGLKASVIIGLVLSSVLTLSACSTGTGIVRETTDVRVSDREGSVKLFNEFMVDTYSAVNQSVKARNDDGEVFTEEIDGDRDRIYHAAGNYTTYAYADGDNFYYITETDDSTTCQNDRSLFESGYYAYKTYITKWEDAFTEGSVKYTCSVHSETYGEEGSIAELSLEVKCGQDSILMTVSKKNGLADKAAYMETWDGESSTTMFLFTYGDATVEIPDIPVREEQLRE